MMRDLLAEGRIRSVAHASILAASLGLCLYSLAVVAVYVSPVLYWDQWEMAKRAATDPGSLLSLRYLLEHHNEHVIATSKLLFLIDYYVFEYTGYVLVAGVLALNVLLATLMARLTFPEPRRRRERLAAACVYGAVMLSLAQWENLTIGFQTQFPLVILFAILAIFAATGTSRFGGTVGDVARWAVSAILAIGAIVSMGNGIALVFSFALLAVLLGRRRRWLGFALLGLLIVAFVPFVVRGGPPLGDAALRTPVNLVLFAVAMIGGPFTPSFPLALVLGTLALAGFCGLAWSLARPWWRGEEVDVAQARLAAIGVFLLGTAAAAAWGRVTLGLEAALSSRYATPMLMLWLVVVAGLARSACRTLGDRSLAMPVVATLLVALVIAATTSLRPENFGKIRAQNERLTRAATFLLWNVPSEGEMVSLYPHPAMITAAVDHLRQARLNLFSPRWGVAAKPDQMPDDLRPGSLAACPSGAVESAARVSADGWSVTGWITDRGLQRLPEWVVATDSSARIIGATRPLLLRPDARAHRPARMRGFHLPLRAEADRPSGPITLVALFGQTRPACTIALDLSLPASRIRGQLPAGIPIAPATQLSGAGPRPGLSPAAETFPVPGVALAGTWQGDDLAAGDLSLTLDPALIGCGPANVPVLRGPLATGLIMTLERDREVERFGLDPLVPHRWGAVEITSEQLCPGGTGRPLMVRLKDSGSILWSWGAMATPMRPSAP
ncbi:hypothetical protein C6569_10835 [Phreatobacter cathodiphilus]|uniref:Uncharacterized protein n=1 Tax=Phreatobacter cathodiphilus TaxID=1868589 RepID=A0A2S0NBH5_9HYPH|nr:hypothetical protein C6569_10835 [Phreatobacter cathodiphilus]